MKKNKKILSLIMAVLMLLSISPIVSFAEDDILSYLSYEIIDGEVTITDCDESISGDVAIPDTIEGYPVTTIGDITAYGPYDEIPWASGAFSNCDNITSIIIPNGVKIIGLQAFCDCDKLKSITIPDSVTEIGSFAFDNCIELEFINIPANVKLIDNYAFNSCDNLKYFTVDENNKYYTVDEYGVLFNNDKTELIQYPIGNSRTEYSISYDINTIGSGAFEKCENLLNIKMPDSVVTIKNRAFSSCTNLENIIIPDNVAIIENNAFNYCSKIKTLTIPGSTTSIDDEAFYYCENLTNISIPDSVTSIGNNAFSDTAYYEDENNWDNGVLYINNHLIEANSSEISGNYEIKLGTITISEYAFTNCVNLTNIVIPDSVTTIGEYAFNLCSNLTDAVIPDSVTTIQTGTFSNCSNLESVNIGNNVTLIEATAFVFCSKLQNIILPNNLKSIGSYAFIGCENLSNIIIPKNVTNIDLGAFYLCNNLKSIKILNADCSIADYSETIDESATIYGYINSTAQAYAEKYNRAFVALCEHNYISGVIKEPTVTEVGIKADVCEYCGDIINAEEIPMLGNDEDVSDNTNNDAETEDNSAKSFIEIIMQFFQKIIDFLKNIFSF